MIATEYNNGLNVVVFCSADYKPIVNDCVNSIEQFVTDTIISRYIISDTMIDINGYNLVKDKDFWSRLDPNFNYRNLYNHSWIKQQIFKLNIDKIVSGNVLIVDAEVRFHRPISWINNNRCTVYYDDKWKKEANSSNEFVKKLVGIEPDPAKTFIVEATIFSTDILKEIHKKIEDEHNLPQLSAYQQIIFDDPLSLNPQPKLFMSEYDMYINYLITFHPEKIHGLVQLNLDDPTFSSIEYSKKSYFSNSQTKWLTFYEQIRDESWPDCDKEEDFDNLPKHIQEECIRVFGYKATNRTI